ncbi:hypothetical protein OpiT1DRAFT_03163 [Opitutaceae bacterium TAV1]|nr:hypothetical protein OpiT1DRAFT_03163 [Opitutaceae bacterium TAV1]
MIESRRQQFLAALIGNWDQQFDPGTGLLAPETTPLRDSLLYALALLEQGEHSRLGRAEAIIRQILSSPSASILDDWSLLSITWIWAHQRNRLGKRVQQSILTVIRQVASNPYIQSLSPLRQFVHLACAKISGIILLPSLKIASGDFQDIGQAVRLLIVTNISGLETEEVLHIQRQCWGLLADYLERLVEYPGDGNLISAIGEADALFIVIEKCTYGRIRVTPPPGEGISSIGGDYLFALITNFDPPSAIARRLKQINRLDYATLQTSLL